MNIPEQFVWIIWDLLAVMIFFHYVRGCAQKGFVSSVVKALAYIGAVAAAHKLYLRVSNFIYDNVVAVAVQHVLTRNINELFDTVGGGEKNILKAVPGPLRLFLGGNREVVSAMPLYGEADVLASSILEMFLKTPLLSLIHAIAFLALFTAASFAIKWLANLFRGINGIPVIGWLNMLLGGILGVLTGCAVLFILAFLLRLAVNASDDGWWWLNHRVMDATYICRVFW